MTEREQYSEPKSKLGIRVSHLREQKNLSQRQLALQLELDRVTLNRIESGIGNPTLDTLMRIASGLGVELEDLFSQAPAS